MKVVLRIKLTEKQKEVDTSTARFKILKWGRRVGKTTFQAFWSAKNALKALKTMNKSVHWHVTKTLNLGRDEFFPTLLNLLPRDLIARVDERLLNVKLTNGSIISVRSGEKEVNLRGRGLSSLCVDEAAFLKESLFYQVLMPQLAHSAGPVLICSSPRKGWFTRAFNDAAAGKLPDWLASHATIYDSTLSAEKIADIKATTPDMTWRQEYMAEELAHVGQVYEEFSAANIYNPNTKFLGWKDLPFVRGIDWGKEANTGVAWLGVSQVGHLIMAQEHVKNGWDVERHAGIIHSKSAGLSIKGDVLDRSASRDIGTGVSIADLFRKQNIFTQESMKDVPASIDMVKRFLRGDGETPWLYISSDCPKTIEALQNWEHGDHEPDIAAALRYAVVMAVNRRMTKLTELPMVRKTKEPFMTDLQLLALQRVKRQSSVRQWAWDSDAGVPN